MYGRDLPDDPRILQLMRDGMPEYEDPICPLCGRECDTVYLAEGEIIGCDVCVERRSAWDTDECFRKMPAPWGDFAGADAGSRHIEGGQYGQQNHQGKRLHIR